MLLRSGSVGSLVQHVRSRNKQEGTSISARTLSEEYTVNWILPTDVLLNHIFLVEACFPVSD